MRILLASLSALGILVSCLALRVHYSNDVEPCNINSRWDCGIVNHSPFAVIHGIPVAAIGIAGYGFLLALSLLGKRRTLALFSGIGFCYALYLTNIERSVLQVWCLYCVCSQVIIALLMCFALVWWLIGRHTQTRTELR